MCNLLLNGPMKKSNILRAALFTAALTAAPLASTFAQAQDAAPAMIDPASLNELNPVERRDKVVDVDPALWAIKDKDTTIYLFGTVHALKPNLGWFDDAVKAAFDKSDTLVLELVQPEAAAMQKLFIDLALDKKGKTLRSKLTEEDRVKYDAALAKLGMPVDRFDPFEPWAAAVTLQLLSLAKDGFDPASGAESIITSAAMQAKKGILGLETAEYQLGIFDTLPEDKQIRFLIDGSADIDKGNEVMEALVAKWSVGDMVALAKLMNDGLTDPVLYDRLLTQRNANWAKWIKERMSTPGTVFIAVGAGHLGGKTSVLRLLKKQKLKAKRVRY
jgi:uncharacterized protein YbaP (TraB family)